MSIDSFYLIHSFKFLGRTIFNDNCANKLCYAFFTVKDGVFYGRCATVVAAEIF